MAVISGGSLENAIRKLGFTPPKHIKLGCWTPFSTNGKAKDDAGRVMLFPDQHGAVIDDWRTGDRSLWFREGIDRNDTAAIARRRVEIKQNQAAAERSLASDYAIAARQAADIIRNSAPAASDHPYLIRKRIPADHLYETTAERLGYQPKSKDEPLTGRILVAPIYSDGELSSVEFIGEDGAKSSLRNGKRTGGMWSPAPITGPVIAIGEGVATMATVGRLTGWSVVTAFGSANLTTVACAIRAGHPECRLIIISDTNLDEKRGGKQAKEAAEAAGAMVLKPVMPVGAKGSDFNDIYVIDPEDARRQLLSPFTEAAPKDPLSEWTDQSTLTGDPPEREWIVDGWLSRGTVTLFAGSGGTGKSLLAQQLMTACAFGFDFLGLRTTQCRSLAAFCEDDQNELHRRAKAICGHYRVDINSSEPGSIRWQGRFGRQNVMATFDGGLIRPTEFFHEVEEAMRLSGASLLILDTAAQLFSGNENDRSEVTQFVNKLGELAIRFNAAVLLLSHPGKAATGLTSEFSGSTAWDGTVRSRWILERPTPEGEQAESDLSDQRILRKAKANYSTFGDKIDLTWDRGAFRVEGPAQLPDAVDRIEIKSNDESDDERFLQSLDILREQGKVVSSSPHARNKAGVTMARLDAWRNTPKVIARIEASMYRLLNAGVIADKVLIRKGAHGRPALEGLARKPAHDPITGEVPI